MTVSVRSLNGEIAAKEEMKDKVDQNGCIGVGDLGPAIVAEYRPECNLHSFGGMINGSGWVIVGVDTQSECLKIVFAPVTEVLG